MLLTSRIYGPEFLHIQDWLHQPKSFTSGLLNRMIHAPEGRKFNSTPKQ